MAYNLIVKESIPSNSDYKYTKFNFPLRIEVDLRNWDSLIEDQSFLGSCVGNAITNAYELLVKQHYPSNFAELSRLFVYYNSRVLDNDVSEDIGATVKSGLQSVKQYGVCTEKLWPYDVNKFDIKPPNECYENAIHRTITKYFRLISTSDMLDALNNNIPIVLGITVFDSFELVSKNNPIVLDPLENELSGGHAMSVVGYNLTKQLFLVKNSYGDNWGENGYCYIPFSYVDRFAFDVWCFEISNQSTILFS